MRYLLILAFFAIAVGVPAVTHQLARRRIDAAITQIGEWQSIPDQEERERCIWDYMRRRTRADAMRWQLAASTTLATVAFAAVSFYVIYDVANESHDLSEQVAELAADNCQLYTQFISDEAGDTSREIDVITAEIVRLQTAIDEAPSQFEEVPAYAEAPPWFRDFLDDYITSQIRDVDQRIDELRGRRSTLEVRESELEALLDMADCPREE